MPTPHPTAICITDHGAVGDGSSPDTTAIQKAIDAASAPGGGGHVVIPRGNFLTGTLFLRSGLWLELRPGAVLTGSPRITDYTPLQAGFQKDLQPYHLLVLDHVDHVRISGPGRIEGSGPAFWQPDPHPSGWFRELGQRPSPMLLCDGCRRLEWDGVEITNSPGWTLHLKQCDDVTIRGVTIRNHLFGPNTDGIDIDGCRDVRISDCLIEAGDDAIVLKTTPDSRTCERVTVTNCSLSTNCRALKLGALESFHDMRDVVFSNCVVRKSVTAIGVYCRSGALIENITFSNIVGHSFSNPDYNQPIHIDSARATPQSRPGRIRNVMIENVICHSNGRILITGEPDHPVENITLRGIQTHLHLPHDPHPGGLTAKGPQFSPATPEARAARAAVVVQHARRLQLRDIDVHWCPSMKFPFHGFWSRDVRDGRIDMSGLSASTPEVSDAHLEYSAIALTSVADNRVTRLPA